MARMNLLLNLYATTKIFSAMAEDSYRGIVALNHRPLFWNIGGK